MTVELALTIGPILGLAVGIAIDWQARRDRDKEIEDLRKQIETERENHFLEVKKIVDELTVQRNVVKSLNSECVRLRRKKNKKNDTNYNDY